MIRRFPEPDHRGDAPTSVRVEALDHLARLASLMDYLLEPRGGHPSPLDAWLSCGGAWSNPAAAAAWDRIVGAAVVTSEMLGRALPEIGDGQRHDVSIAFLVRWLRDGYVDGLRELWRSWPRDRDDLRRFLHRHVRRDEPKDLRPIERAMRACGLAEPGPDGARVEEALRRVLLDLLLRAGSEATRADMRRAMEEVASARVPRRARHSLARALAQRVCDAEHRLIEDAVFLGDPGRSTPLPAPLVGAALLLLAAADVMEAGGKPGFLWRARSAHGVLYKLRENPAWGDDLRDAMEAVLHGTLGTGALTRVVETAIEAVGAPLEAPPLAVATEPATGEAGVEPSEHAGSGDAVGMGSAADRGALLSSTPLGGAATGSKRGPLAETETGGDGTETSGSTFRAGVARVSSPAPSTERGVAGEPVARASRGGDGTETSEAASQAGHAEVSSPRGPRAEVTAGPPGQEKGTPNGETGATPQFPPMRPEDVALAYLARAVREGRPVPSRAECARVAGVRRQATTKWASFDAIWRNARATEKGPIRRGHRNARTGDVEAEDDSG